MTILAGETWRLFFRPDNPNNALFHIRAVVDERQIVYRVWSRRKQDWQYKVDDIYMFELYHRDGSLRRKEGA